MALIRHNNTDMFVDLSDKVVAGTRIKRKAELVDLYYSTMKKRVAVEVRVHVYAVAQNEFGDEIYGQLLDNEPGFSPYHKAIIADNTTVVDATTGAILGSDTDLMDEANFLPPVEAKEAVLDVDGIVVEPAVEARPAGKFYGVDYMFEFEFFKRIAETSPVIVDQLIIQKVQGADALGRI
jgi:hypothetical protein